MNIEEFWNHYVNQDILEIFDIICDFFSDEVPEEFLEKYEIGEVITQTTGTLADAKDFNKLLKFKKVMQNNNPGIYYDYFQYFVSDLIDYYCFYDESDKLEKNLNDYINNPIQGFDYYINSFLELLYYQKIDLIDQAIEKNYETLRSSRELIGLAEYDFTDTKFYLLLDQCYQEWENNGQFNIEEFVRLIKKYNFSPSRDYLSSLKKGLVNPIPSKII